MLMISTSTVRKLKAEGKLPKPRQIGGSARYLVRELIEAVEAAPVSSLLPPPTGEGKRAERRLKGAA